MQFLCVQNSIFAKQEQSFCRKLAKTIVGFRALQINGNRSKTANFSHPKHASLLFASFQCCLLLANMNQMKFKLTIMVELATLI